MHNRSKIWLVAAAALLALSGCDRHLQVAGQTDSTAFNTLLDAVNKTTLRDRMVQAIRYDFAKDYEAGLRKADKWLQAEPFEGFVFKGELGQAHIRDVRIAPDGLLVEADATGSGAMTYAPKEAMKLIVERRARRAEREAAKARAAADTADAAAQ